MNPNLKLLQEPSLSVLNNVIHNSSDDSPMRTMAVTSMALSLWQSMERGNTHQPPSFIFIAPEGRNTSPLQVITDAVLGTTKPIKDKIRDDSSKAMIDAILIQQNQDNTFPTTTWEDNYHTARIAGYGSGDVGDYAKSWHPNIGLITDEKNSIILRLNDEADRVTFKKDLLEAPSKLLLPIGIGKGLIQHNKQLSINGALSLEENSDTVTDSLLKLGIPFFILPTPDSSEPSVNPRALHAFSYLLANKPDTTILTNPRLFPYTYYQHHQTFLWTRLEKLPLECRFPIIESVHRLSSACEQIALHAGLLSKQDEKQIIELMMNLHSITLRGISISIAYLAWYGLGFHLGCPLKKARKLLHKLRKDGPLSLREIQRTIGLKSATTRDNVLKNLMQEGLITIEGKIVSAVTHTDFVAELFRRDDLLKPILIGKPPTNNKVATAQ